MDNLDGNIDTGYAAMQTPENKTPRVLYFNFHADEERHRRKLAGIRRFAKTQGWSVAAVPNRTRPQWCAERIAAFRALCDKTGRPCHVFGGHGKSITYGPLCVLRFKSTLGHGRHDPRILEAVEIIRREACNGLSAARLAAHFPGSRGHFERRFREAMGHSVLNEILHVRLEQARTLLASTEMPVAAIADFCGFGTVRELRKLFRARHEMSMRQFRSDHRR